MNPSIIILSGLCFFVLLLSAFISASETALFSIPRERIDAFEKHGARSRRLIYSLLMDGQRTLLLILLANTFVNLTLAGLINSLMAAVLGRNAEFWGFLTATAVIITFGEVVPKNGALSRNEQIAALASPVLHYLKIITAPLLDLLQKVNQFFLERFKLHLRRPSPFITVDELKSAVQNSLKQGVISKWEQDVITSLLDRGAQPVKRYMIHRSQALLLPQDSTVQDGLKELAAKGQTYGLLTRGRGRQITGLVRLPDLLAASPQYRCRKLAITPEWTAETLEVADLISFMFAQKLDVVCVLDEFGGFSGVFSLSEGLKKVMQFRKERADQQSIGLSTKVFSGLQEIESMREWLPKTLAAEALNVRTLNGLLTRHLGRIPKTGERFAVDGWDFYIMSSGLTKIESVLIRKEDQRGDEYEC
ncbi:MAG: CNNM domain-containing protein [Chitinispirillales bacterium]|jgi:CBS domain containing-hemolysin-like protein|nr:CNNM domain-containing protein [Chitinispirillales bacterium]